MTNPRFLISAVMVIYLVGQGLSKVSATLCHAGTRGKGGQCNCAAAIGWVDGEWWNPWCYEGRCYTGQVYNDCVGQANGASLGDGTWCWNEDRNTECPTETATCTTASDCLEQEKCVNGKCQGKETLVLVECDSDACLNDQLKRVESFYGIALNGTTCTTGEGTTQDGTAGDGTTEMPEENGTTEEE